MSFIKSSKKKKKERLILSFSKPLRQLLNKSNLVHLVYRKTVEVSTLSSNQPGEEYSTDKNGHGINVICLKICY